MGGPAHQAALLSGRRFPTDRYETLLVHGSLPEGEESAAFLAEREGAREVQLPTLVQPISPVNDAQAHLALSRIIRRFKPDIVHTHTAKAGFLGRGAALAATPGRRPKLVHTFHGHVLEGYFGPRRERAYRFLERTLARQTDCLVGVSDATIDDLVRLGVAPRERFRRVPLGLDLETIAAGAPALRHATRADLGVADEEVLCMFVGRIAPIKRVDRLLDAFAIAHRDAAHLRLAIVGDGVERADLEAHAGRLGIADRVLWLGYRTDLEGLFGAADIAVLSSDNEGTPVSLIEAAAAGVPAVATDVGGVSEVVSPEVGVLVAPGDVEGLGAGIAALAHDVERRRALAFRASERALARYSAARLCDDLDRLYSELAEPATASR